jgi:hypothetical protein
MEGDTISGTTITINISVNVSVIVAFVDVGYASSATITTHWVSSEQHSFSMD